VTNSPTAGFSALNADKAGKSLTDNGDEYVISDSIARGEYAHDIGSELDARVKCAKCNMVTLHEGFTVNSFDVAGVTRNVIRVYCCTVCGIFTTKRA